MNKKNEWSDVYIWGLAAFFVLALNLTTAFNKPSKEEEACSSNSLRTEAMVLANTNIISHHYGCFNG